MDVLQQVGSNILENFQQNPNLFIALIIFLAFILLSYRVRGRLQPWIELAEEPNASQGLVRFIYLGILLFGLFIALAIAIPGFDPLARLMALDIGVDFSLAFQQVIEMINGLIVRLPNFIVAFVLYTFSRLAAHPVQIAITKVLESSGRSPSAAKVFGRLASYATTIGGVIIALMIIIPGFNPTTLISGLGIGSVAIGFAFRDILQNFLAGLLLLLTDPFRIGDQIVVKGFEGTVEDIQIRATILKTYDGRQVVIPNSDVFTESVTVNTAYEKRRSHYDVGIGYGDDIDEAITLTIKAMRSVDGVLDDPAPTVQVVELADSSVNLRALWWTESQNGNVTELRNQVLIAIKKKNVKMA